MEYYQQVLTACIFYILAYSYILFAANQLQNGKNTALYESCWVNIPCDISKCRGKKYNIVRPNHCGYNNCILTFWNFTHIVLYTMMGFFCPDLFVEAMTVGAIFELAEFQMYDCHDLLDIFYNAAGFVAGSYLRRLIW